MDTTQPAAPGPANEAPTTEFRRSQRSIAAAIAVQLAGATVVAVRAATNMADAAGAGQRLPWGLAALAVVMFTVAAVLATLALRRAGRASSAAGPAAGATDALASMRAAAWGAAGLMAAVALAMLYMQQDRWDRQQASAQAIAQAEPCVRDRIAAAAHAMQWHGVRAPTNADLARYARQCSESRAGAAASALPAPR